DGDRHRFRFAADGSGRPVPRPQSFAEGDAFGEYVQIHASRFRHAVPSYEDCPLQLGYVLDLLAHLAVADVALRFAVTPEWIEIDRPGHAQHLARVADHEHRADRLALAPLSADLRGQVYHCSKGFQRHVRVQFSQVLGTQPLQMLAQVDNADGVNLL